MTKFEILIDYLGQPNLELAFEQQVLEFLSARAHSYTAKHSVEVANEAVVLAKRFGSEPKQAKIAGYLHDISAVIPNSERIGLADKLDIDVLTEERILPMIVHQKLSAIMAQELFNITDNEILSAIACHTTLKAKSTVLDKVVFVADKIRWDGQGKPPYIKGLLKALDSSLDAASFYYIDYLYQQKEILPVVHPYLLAVYHELKGAIKKI